MNFNDNKPIYRQIIDYCFGCILSGQWLPDHRIPSVREMAQQLAVNTHTVLKAFEYLQGADIILPRRGMGSFLAADAPDRVVSARRQEFFDETLPDIFRQMQLLGISIDDVAARFPGSNAGKAIE